MADNFQVSKVSPNEQSSATKFNNFVQSVEDAINSLDNSNISAAANIDVTKIAAGSNGNVLTTTAGVVGWATPGSTVVPTGAVTMYAAAAAPSGWVLCDGTSYLRSGGGVDALFAVIGTTYGSVDGTHFNVPDFRGRVPTGYAASGGHTDVSTLGNNDGVAAANRRSKHRHTPHSHTYDTRDGATGASQAFRQGNNVLTAFPTSFADGGSGNANDSLDAPAYLVVNYIIKT